MSLETETVLDRRRLRRSLSFWRVIAVIGLVVGAGALALGSSSGMKLGDSAQIARITVEGVITESRDQLKLLKKIADAKHVKGVIVYVNSPGGTTTGGEAMYEALRNLSQKKPVVAQFGTVAASAAYITGLGTDHIVARGNTITGSVGVIFQWAEVSQLLDKVGVKMNEIKSGPLKANPSPFTPIDEPGRKVTEAMVAESQGWFLGLVKQRRAINTAEVPGLEQGRVFSGREALTYKLVDEIGGEAEAVQWMENKRSVQKGLRVVEWKPKSDLDWAGGFSGSLAGGIARLLGLDPSDVNRFLAQASMLGRLGLDGLVSVWQPSDI